MRHRLACSLLDLHVLDRHRDPAAQRRQQQAAPLRAPRDDRGRADTAETPPLQGYFRQLENDLNLFYQDRYWRDGAVARSYAGALNTAHLAAPDHHHHRLSEQRVQSPQPPPSLSKSYEGGLHTAHLSKAAPSAKLASWRSHEDGLDGPRPGARPKVLLHDAFKPGQGGIAVADPLMTSERLPRGGGRNPYRWRQGIVEDTRQLPSPTTRTHHKSNEFISPSFLKPFRSMNSLHLDHDLSPSRDLPFSFPHRPGYDRGGKVAGSDPEGQTEFQGRDPRGFKGHYSESPEESDSTPEAMHQDYRRPSLERMSDEVEQEYLSQDEVESSLKRSQKILMEAEEEMRNPSACSDEDDSTAPSPDSQSDQHTSLSTPPNKHPQLPAGKDGHLGEYESIQVHITDPDNNDVNINDNEEEEEEEEAWEDSTVASGSPRSKQNRSRDADWDADVSNMSDTVTEMTKQQC